MTILRFSTFLLAAALVMPSSASAQETAGRVLTAVGDVAVVRGTSRINAHNGTQLLSGDQIELGAASNAQIHMTDESVIALRPDTTFRITDYAFQGRDPGQRRAFFDLIKGGMRTVTGLIGKAQRPQDYRVTTPTSTIGIRGTHYKLAHTDQGTYGGVTEGRISVSNRAGESVFGSDQFFLVASLDARPERLIGPPPILNDRLEGAKRRASAAQAEQKAAASKEGEAVPAAVAQTGADGGNGDARSSGAVLTEQVATVPTTLVQQNTAANVVPLNSGTVFYRLQGPFNIPLTSGGRLVDGDITMSVNLSLRQVGITANMLATDGGIANISTPFGATTAGIPLTVDAGQLSFNATFNRADYPQNAGAFRCSTCGPGDSVSFFDTISFKGTISGATADLTVSANDTGSVTNDSASMQLTLQTPPNNFVAAIVTPRAGGGADARSAAFWGVQLDASRRLTDFGPTVGGPAAHVGSATNTLVGSASSAGNLAWGTWTGAGATITDVNYTTFTPTSGSYWISGEATTSLPSSLGVLTFTPVGWALGNGVFNAGSLTADFVNRNLSVSLNATNPAANNTFQMNGSTGFSGSTGRFSAGFTSVTCTGTCAGATAPSGSFGGFFAGQNAEGVGLAFSAGFGVGTGVNGVVGFKR